MTTNAQAALIAAATLVAVKAHPTAQGVTDTSKQFKIWLDSQDAKDREAANDYPSPVPDFGMTTREEAVQERPIEPCPKALAYNIFETHPPHVNGVTLCPGAQAQRRREEALRMFAERENVRAAEASVSGWLTDEELATTQPSRPLSAAIGAALAKAADQAGVDYAG